MTPQKTKLQIIEEVLGIYIADPSKRAIDEIGRCMYFLPATSENTTPKMCAVGMCLIDPKLYKHVTGGVIDLADDLDERLKPEYRGHDVYFWNQLQNIHDCAPYWNKNGLTGEGISAYKELKKRYSENE